MDFNTLEYLDKLWKNSKELGIHKHIIRLPDLLLHPRQFWKDYELLPIKDKAIQFITYGAILTLTIWIASYSDLSTMELTKITAIEIAAMFVYVLILYVANSIVKKCWKGIGFFVVLCCYIKFIFAASQIIVLRFYYDTETPLLMAVFSITPLVAEFLLLFYSAYIWQEGRRKVVYAVFLSVVFLNIYDCLFIATGWPMPNNLNSENKIAKERFEQGRSIKNAYDIPYCVASHDKGNVIGYLYSNPIDTVACFKFDNPEKYIEIVKEDMDSLRVISDRCFFKANRIFFNQMYVLKKKIVYVHETKMFRKSPIIKQTDIMYDSIIVDRIIYQEFNRDLQEENTKLLEADIKQAEQFDAARSANYFGVLWHPCLYINFFCSLEDKGMRYEL